MRSSRARFTKPEWRRAFPRMARSQDPTRAGSNRCQPGSRRRFLGLAVLMMALIFPALASAQDASFGFKVTVLHTSPEGKVGPKAKRFHRLLGRRVKYGGIRVVNSKATRVKVNNIGGIKLPDGTRFRFRPIDGGGPGALVAVDMGRTQGDFRLPAGKPLILGGSSWRGGKLVVVLELTE